MAHGHEGVQDPPLISTFMTLQIPNIVIVPTLEEIQWHFSRVVANVVDVQKSVILWGQRSADPKNPDFEVDEDDDLTLRYKTYHRNVSEHKEVTRTLISLQGAMLLLKPDVSRACESYQEFAYLWAETRDDQVKTFVATEPIVQEIKEEFTKYMEIADEIHALPGNVVVGAIDILMRKHRSGLNIS